MIVVHHLNNSRPAYRKAIERGGEYQLLK